MKLKTFNQANSSFNRTASIPMITITKSGVISLNKGLCEHLSLTEEKSILIHQDEDNLEDWYIEPVSSDNAFKLRTYKHQNGLCFNSAFLASKILDSVKEESTCRFKVALKPMEEFDNPIYAILTSSKMVNNKK